jgi:hypothetical protein
MDVEKVFGSADWQLIKGEVQSTYSEHFSQYSYAKYPALDYQRFKQTSNLSSNWIWHCSGSGGTGGRPIIPVNRGY